MHLHFSESKPDRILMVNKKGCRISLISCFTVSKNFLSFVSSEMNFRIFCSLENLFVKVLYISVFLNTKEVYLSYSRNYNRKEGVLFR